MKAIRAKRATGHVLVLALVASLLALAPAVVGPPPAEAAFPGTNGYIAYVEGGTLLLMAPDGSDQRTLLQLGSSITEPSFSPTSDRVAYFENDSLQVIDVEAVIDDPYGTSPGYISSACVSAGICESPKWSPDGTQIAYVDTEASPSQTSEIFIVDVDDSNNTQRTFDAAVGPIAWSPDGSLLAFGAWNGTEYQLHTLDPFGSDDPAPLGPAQPGAISNLDWSPDGEALVFSVDSDPGAGANPDIWTISADGTTSDRLTTDPGVDSSPTFSPDGTKIAFSSNRDGTHHIFVMDADGADQAAVTDGLDGEYSPSWGSYEPPPPAAATISGHVFIDDGSYNGVWSPGAPGIEGVTIELSGPSSISTATDVDGYFAFTGLPAGDYVVTQPAQPAGYLDGPDSVGANPTPSDVIDLAGICCAESQTEDTLSFGEYESASIAGLVYEDADGDGNWSDGVETGIVDAEMILSGTDDLGDPVFDTTTTDATGAWEFPGLRPGTYEVSQSSQPAGYPDGVETVGGCAGTAVDDAIGDIAVYPGSQCAEYWFGEGVGSPPAPIGDLVWDDQNADGVQNNGEPGLAGVTVRLLDGGDTEIDSTVTDGDGRYMFDPGAGDYRVEVDVPVDRVVTVADQGGDDTLDSDADPATGWSPLVSLGASEIRDDLDVGLYETTGVGGHVFIDASGGGIYGSGDPGIADVTIELSGTDDLGNPVSASATTDADGYFDFAGLRVGSYVVTQPTQPVGYLDGDDTAGSILSPTDDEIDLSGICCTPGTVHTDAAFGEFLPASISGLVYEDLDEDGNWADGVEPGIAGVEITLAGTDDRGNPVDETTATGADGYWEFTALRPGDYTVTETQPIGYSDGIDIGSGAGCAAGSGSDFFDIALPPGLDCVENWFGEIVVPTTGSVGDRVWDDLDGNSVQDPGEPGLGGVAVRLLDVDGQEIAATTSDPDGSYEFADLDTGSYQIEVVAPAGRLFARPDQGGDDSADSDVATTTGRSAFAVVTPTADTSVDAGLFVAARVAGHVYIDSDDDGSGWSEGAGGVPNVVIRLTGSDDTGPISARDATTDATGAYAFSGLRPGTYTISQLAQPAGYLDGKDSYNGVVIGVNDVFTDRVVVVGDDQATYDFGERPLPTVTGVVFHDRDNDGVRLTTDPTYPEAGVGGVTMRLTRTSPASPAVTLTATTGSDGTFTFQAGLTSGTWTLTELQPAGYWDGKFPSAAPSGGTASGNTVSGIIVTASTATLAGYRFAEVTPVRISGTVYVDADQDGAFDPGEVKLPNTRVRVTGVSDQGAITPVDLLTSATGAFDTGSLRPGSYTLTETQPPQLSEGGEHTGTTSGSAGPSSTSGGFNELIWTDLPSGSVVTGAEFRERQASGKAWSWGSNANGELGAGMEYSTIPATIAGTNVTDADVGGWGFDGEFYQGQHIVVAAAGFAYTWGSNYHGQLGDGTRTDRFNPVLVRKANGTPLTGVVEVAAGGCASAALTSDGKVWTWGCVQEIGRPALSWTDDPRAAPIAANWSPAPPTFVEIEGSDQGFLARTSGKAAYYWGSWANQVASGSVDDITFVRAGVEQLSSGGALAGWEGEGTVTLPLAVRTTLNQVEYLTIRNGAFRLEPMRTVTDAVLGNIVDVAGGGGGTLLARDTQGRVWEYGIGRARVKTGLPPGVVDIGVGGYAAGGRFGEGSPASSYFAVVSCGASCRKVYAWGGNGLFGQGLSDGMTSSVPREIPTLRLRTGTVPVGGRGITLFIRSDNRLAAAGRYVGLSGSGLAQPRRPAAAVSTGDVVRLEASGTHEVAAVTAANTAAMWGANWNGSTGNRPGQPMGTPRSPILPGVVDVTVASVRGSMQTVILRADGTVWTIGECSLARPICGPRPEPGLQDIVDVDGVFALTRSGQVLQVPSGGQVGMSGIAQIEGSESGYWVIGIRNSGDAFTWGPSSCGWLNPGPCTGGVRALSHIGLVRQVDVSALAAIARRVDGSVVTWGADNQAGGWGQLKVWPALGGAIDVAAGDGAFLAAKGGFAYGWAVTDLERNAAVTGAPVAPRNPARVPGPTNVRDVEIGARTGFAIAGPILDPLPPVEETATATSVPAGSTFSTDGEGDGATEDDPMETTVQLGANSGPVSVTEQPSRGTPPAGFGMLNYRITITAPDGTEADPLRLQFRLDASLRPGSSWSSLTAFRNGVAVLACTGAPSAIPSPCEVERLVLPDGDLQLTVLTIQASDWEFGIPAPTAASIESPAPVLEGGELTLDASASTSPDGLPLAYNWSPSTRIDGNGPVVNFDTGDDFAGTVTVTVEDGSGGFDSSTADVVVTNAAPTVGPITTHGTLAARNPFTLLAGVTDPGVRDTHTAAVNWGDGHTTTEPVVDGEVQGAHAYAAAGTYTVLVTVTDDDGGDGTVSTSLNVAAASGSTNVVWGVLRDSTGRPLPGMTPRAYVTTSVLPKSCAASDAYGVYRCANLANGSYQVWVVPPSGWVDTWLPGTRVKAAAQLVPVSGGTAGRVDGTILRNEETGTVSGTVECGVPHSGCSTVGSPVSGVWAYLYDANGVLVDRATTNAEGVYVIPKVRPGEYTVWVWKSGISQAWYVNANARSTATSITVTADEPVTANQDLCGNGGSACPSG